jgi:hypothetical protein
MTDDLRKSVSILQELSPKLNKLSDQAVDTVKLVEQFLNEQCSLGIKASVCVEGYGHPQDGEDGSGK